MTAKPKCIVEPGHERHYAVRAVPASNAMRDTAYYCYCRNCGKRWHEYKFTGVARDASPEHNGGTKHG